MTASATVDVGVVTWNTAELSAIALRRLLDSDQGCVLRLLVRDNGSSDGTPELLARQVPEAEVEIGTNLGFAGGVNTLLARSTAPFFLALNSDAWPEPGAIGRLVAAAQERPRAAIVVPRLERPDGTLEHSTFPFPSLPVGALMATRVHRRHPDLAEAWCLEGYWRHDRPRPVPWAVGAAWLMRREAVEELGGLDERFFMYAEDVEWCWRARKAGWVVHFEPSALVRHVGNASASQSYGSRRKAAHLRNTYRFYVGEHGVAADAAYRALNLVGAARNWRTAVRAGDAVDAAAWRSEVRAHLEPVPRVDGPPRADLYPRQAVTPDRP